MEVTNITISQLKFTRHVITGYNKETRLAPAVGSVDDVLHVDTVSWPSM
jgi:hypothetical protein